jgi:hypothetical protein
MSQWTPRSATYRTLAAKVKYQEPFCHICGERIDPGLRYPDPWSFSCDHLKSPKLRPDLAEDRRNLRASHLVCNQRRQMGQNDATPRPSGSGRSVVDF